MKDAGVFASADGRSSGSEADGRTADRVRWVCLDVDELGGRHRQK